MNSQIIEGTYMSCQVKLVSNTLSLVNTTASIEDSVDHIILSRTILNNREVKISTWNTVKELSDHIGICVTIIE